MKIIFFDVQDNELDFLKQNCPQDIEALYLKTSAGRGFEGDSESVDAICVFALNPMDANVLRQFKNLKYIFTRSAGFSHIDKNYCRTNNIKVFNTPHYGDYTIAEFAFGILLCAVRKIKQASNALLEGNAYLQNFAGLELYSKTIGIIGLGGIGQKAAKIAEGFSMNVLCYDIIPKEGYNCVSLAQLCEESDIISIHTPLTETNYHMLDAEMFEKMKDGVVIINTARGELIDTRVLVAAIESKKVAFAALDVVECENVLTCHTLGDFSIDVVEEHCLKIFMLNRKLLSFPNVLVTPHIAYDTTEGVERILKITIENIKNVQINKYENMVF